MLSYLTSALRPVKNGSLAADLDAFLRGHYNTLKEAFEAFDTAGTGQLGEKCLVEGLKRLGYGGDGAQIFHAMDYGNTGTISIRTFLLYFSSHGDMPRLCSGSNAISLLSEDLEEGYEAFLLQLEKRLVAVEALVGLGPNPPMFSLQLPPYDVGWGESPIINGTETASAQMPSNETADDSWLTSSLRVMNAARDRKVQCSHQFAPCSAACPAKGSFSGERFACDSKSPKAVSFLNTASVVESATYGEEVSLPGTVSILDCSGPGDGVDASEPSLWDVSDMLLLKLEARHSHLRVELQWLRKSVQNLQSHADALEAQVVFLSDTVSQGSMDWQVSLANRVDRASESVGELRDELGKIVSRTSWCTVPMMDTVMQDKIDALKHELEDRIDALRHG